MYLLAEKDNAPSSTPIDLFILLFQYPNNSIEAMRTNSIDGKFVNAFPARRSYVLLEGSGRKIASNIKTFLDFSNKIWRYLKRYCKVWNRKATVEVA
jgi:hypothetical protein